ncbi:hypothetical protein FF011L_47710 [Roseimaritima multifibrata]|uniref:Uncharacterized protein n=1 Tax=Roseimaritima multifibrata TaxID=1930274 RepID=A0A517MM74_9BACT|nr:hypothetical protein [Roseimaritima multifibrata]QDS95969.1 hypothetical protein FF011L_47710 [Roseimaritima multifibrata]
MGFLKRILRSTGPEGAVNTDPAGSFERLSDEELQAHMGIDRYDSFYLTNAIRPSYDLQVIPRQGFRHDEYRDDASGARVPVLMASASRPDLLDLFLELIDPLGPVVDVVLETSHHATAGHQDLYREHIDVPVLKSTLLEFEDLLLNDGCTGIAVVNPQKQQEVQFDEHKMLIAYGHPLKEFERVLIAGDVFPDPDIRFITEAEHVHSSTDRYIHDFEILKSRLGMDSDWN